MRPGLLFALFFALCGLGIVASLVSRPSRQGRVVACAGAAAALALLLAGCDVLLAGHTVTLALWLVPGMTTLTLACDRLSAILIVVTGVVLAPASVYAGRESGGESRGRNVRSFAVMLLGLYASIALIYLAGDALTFLLAWEVMSILCYLLIAGAREGEGNRVGSGYLMLGLGEAGTLAAALGIVVLASGAGTLVFPSLRSAAAAMTPGEHWAAFLLTFFGFGVKAGLVPVNFWLPRAYTSARRAFAPVLAGATLNLGLYGILRFNADLMPPVEAGPGLVALVVGATSALLGILYATTDNDMKRMLSQSSIENAGIVVAGFGAGMVFVATGHPALAAIAWVAALYHLINHSVYKTLLFFGIGVVESATGTRDMDRLGGLIRWMPVTAAGMLVGSLAIAGLPPFNGFVSEWLTLQTMLRSVELSSIPTRIVFALCGAVLALTAALAVTCFVKVFAMTFLGMRRLDETRRVVEPSRGALAPITVLAVCCLLLGVLPTYVIPLIGSALPGLSPASASDQLVPPFFAGAAAHASLPAAFVADFHAIGAQLGQSFLPGRGLVVLHRGGAANPVVFAMSTAWLAVTLAVLLALTFAIFRLWLTRRRALSRRERWDGGLRRLLPEMTYTATGFSNPVRVVFEAIFRPTTIEDTSETVAEHFRNAIRRERETVHVVDKLLLRPVRSAMLWLAKGLARMHHGRINTYAAYVLLALAAALIVTAA